LGLWLALKHLLHRLELKGTVSYQEVQRMLDQALGDVKRFKIEEALTPAAAQEAINVISELHYRE